MRWLYKIGNLTTITLAHAHYMNPIFQYNLDLRVSRIYFPCTAECVKQNILELWLIYTICTINFELETVGAVTILYLIQQSLHTQIKLVL